MLGDPLDPEKWENIKDSGQVPEYLKDIEIYTEKDRVTRQKLPVDTHLIETQKQNNQSNNTESTGDEADLDEDDIFEEISQGELLTQLRELHNNGLLNRENIELREVPVIHREMINNPEIRGINPAQIIDDVLPTEEDDEVGEVVEERDQVVVDHRGDVHEDNILPEGARRRVRFRIPVLNAVNICINRKNVEKNLTQCIDRKNEERNRAVLKK